MQTPNCIRACAFDGICLDYHVTVSADATASASQAVQDANLHGVFPCLDTCMILNSCAPLSGLPQPCTEDLAVGVRRYVQHRCQDSNNPRHRGRLGLTSAQWINPACSTDVSLLRGTASGAPVYDILALHDVMNSWLPGSRSIMHGHLQWKHPLCSRESLPQKLSARTAVTSSCSQPHCGVSRYSSVLTNLDTSLMPQALSSAYDSSVSRSIPAPVTRHKESTHKPTPLLCLPP